MINLLLVDDNSHMNQRVMDASKQLDYNFNVVGSTTSGSDVLEQLQLFNVDIVLLDIIKPEMDGIYCCQQIKEIYPAIKVITFIGDLEPSLLLKIWLQKVDGILLKNCSLNELATTLVNVMKGQKIIGENVYNFFKNVGIETKLIPKLSKTEIEVLKLLGSGLRRKEVAVKMNKSVYSVEFHCKNLSRKFNSNRMRTILDEARKRGIIQ